MRLNAIRRTADRQSNIAQAWPDCAIRGRCDLYGLASPVFSEQHPGIGQNVTFPRKFGTFRGLKRVPLITLVRGATQYRGSHNASR